jgi:hypothetical protein
MSTGIVFLRAQSLDFTILGLRPAGSLQQSHAPFQELIEYIYQWDGNVREMTNL